MLRIKSEGLSFSTATTCIYMKVFYNWVSFISPLSLYSIIKLQPSPQKSCSPPVRQWTRRTAGKRNKLENTEDAIWFKKQFVFFINWSDVSSIKLTTSMAKKKKKEILLHITLLAVYIQEHWLIFFFLMWVNSYTGSNQRSIQLISFSTTELVADAYKKVWRIEQTESESFPSIPF